MAFFLAARWTASAPTSGPPFAPGARKASAAARTWWCSCGGVWWSWALRRLAKRRNHGEGVGGLPSPNWKSWDSCGFDDWTCWILIEVFLGIFRMVLMIGPFLILMGFSGFWIVINGCGDRDTKSTGYPGYHIFLDCCDLLFIYHAPRVDLLSWWLLHFPLGTSTRMGTEDHFFEHLAEMGNGDLIYWACWE